MRKKLKEVKVGDTVFLYRGVVPPVEAEIVHVHGFLYEADVVNSQEKTIVERDFIYTQDELHELFQVLDSIISQMQGFIDKHHL